MSVPPHLLPFPFQIMLDNTALVLMFYTMEIGFILQCSHMKQRAVSHDQKLAHALVACLLMWKKEPWFFSFNHVYSVYTRNGKQFCPKRFWIESMPSLLSSRSQAGQKYRKSLSCLHLRWRLSDVCGWIFHSQEFSLKKPHHYIWPSSRCK